MELTRARSFAITISTEEEATSFYSNPMHNMNEPRRFRSHRAALEAMTSLAEQRLDEVVNAWQEFLCWELERATKALDQPALKAALARARALSFNAFSLCTRPLFHLSISKRHFHHSVHHEERPEQNDENDVLLLRRRNPGGKSFAV